ncbi:MAG: oxidoreductase, partial [Betaproteobacteria bacterium]
IMATDQAKEWGETEYRYWYTGHIHHDTLKEYAGCKVESFRTIAGKDAYATWNGYRSGQDSKCIVLDRHHGEVERHTVNIGMVR